MSMEEEMLQELSEPKKEIAGQSNGSLGGESDRYSHVSGIRSPTRYLNIAPTVFGCE